MKTQTVTTDDKSSFYLDIDGTPITAYGILNDGSPVIVFPSKLKNSNGDIRFFGFYADSMVKLYSNTNVNVTIFYTETY